MLYARVILRLLVSHEIQYTAIIGNEIVGMNRFNCDLVLSKVLSVLTYLLAPWSRVLP